MRTKRNHLHELIVCVTLGLAGAVCFMIVLMITVDKLTIYGFFDKVDNIETIVKK